MAKRPATKAEKKHMGDVAALGCFICRRLGYGPTPAQVHHLREGQGMGQRGSHVLTIPLCEVHHANHSKDGIHGGREVWKRMGLDEMDALEDTLRCLLNVR